MSNNAQEKNLQRGLTRTLFGLSCAVLNLAHVSAGAAEFPAAPIRLIVPFAPGAAPDAVARLIAQPLGASLGQPVVIDNRPGAGGVIGVQTLAKASPDGHTIGIVSSGVIAGLSAAGEPVNPTNDLTPIALLTSAPLVLATSASSDITTVQALVQRAKAQPDKFPIGVAGTSAAAAAARAFNSSAGLRLTVIPYKGTPAVIEDLIAGRIQATFAEPGSILPHVKAGRVRMLAVTTPTRSRFLPDIPTLNESGFPGMDMRSWVGLAGPKGMPRGIVNRLHADVAKALRTPEVQKRLEADFMEAEPLSPEAFATFLRQQTARIAAYTHGSGGGAAPTCPAGECYCRARKGCKTAPCGSECET